MKNVAYVHLGHGFGAASYSERFRRGLVPDEVPYGFHHAASNAWEITYSVDAPEGLGARFVRRTLNALLGFDPVHAWRNRRRIAAADVVWTMEERQGLAVLFLSLFRRTPPVLLQIIWLFDTWQSMGPVRRALLRVLLRRAARITVHSREYETADRFGEGIETQLLPFGISADTFRGRTEARALHQPVRVLAMGSDPTRDWQTFLQAFGGDDRFAVVAISPHLHSERVAGMTNVTVPVAPTMQEFVEFYGWADVVVVPMVRNLYSGITVALEATQQGVPVVASRTGGVPTYLAEDEAVYVEPQNAEALRAAVLGCKEAQLQAVVARAQRRFAAEDYTTRGMAGRYVQLSEQVLAERAQVPQTA